MTSDCRILSLCVIKNEADIIADCLAAASEWSEKIYVFDNGSTDGTWDKVLECASDRVVPWKTDSSLFRESMRGDLFNAFRHEAREGDWWCRLDADEFYVEDPRHFLAQIGPSEHVVWGVGIDYYLTDRDVEAIEFQQPIAEVLPQLRYYKVTSSEPRFVRHRNRLIWKSTDAWPCHMGVVHKRRIAYRHYKYRSPTQVQRRLETRKNVIASGGDYWWAQQAATWRECICKPESLCYDDQSGKFEIDETILPPHLEPPMKRFAKQVMHTCRVWP